MTYFSHRLLGVLSSRPCRSSNEIQTALNVNTATFHSNCVMFVGTVHSVFCEVICLWMFVPKYVWFTDPCVFAQITKISEPKHVEVC